MMTAPQTWQIIGVALFVKYMKMSLEIGAVLEIVQAL